MLREIRQQPEHIRSIFMWLSVFIVFSVIVFVWIQGFQERLVYLLNPSPAPAAVEKNSPLAIIGENFNDLKAVILDLFGLATGTKNQTEIPNGLEKKSDIEPRLLPLSE